MDNTILVPPVGEHIIHAPVLLPRKKKLLSLPNNRTHPLLPKLHLVAMLISGNPLKIREFWKRLRTSSLIHGDQKQKADTTQFSSNGNFFVVKGMKILMHQI